MTLSRLEKDWKLLVDRSSLELPTDKILDLGWQFTTSFLIIDVSTQNQRNTWQVGGTIWATSLIKGTQTRFFTKQLDLFAQELIEIPNPIKDKYSLYYRAPKHFNNIRIKIYEYLKEDSLTENISFLINQNLRIEESIKELINKVDKLTIPNNTPTEQQKLLLPFL